MMWLQQQRRQQEAEAVLAGDASRSHEQQRPQRRDAEEAGFKGGQQRRGWDESQGRPLEPSRGEVRGGIIRELC